MITFLLCQGKMTLKIHLSKSVSQIKICDSSEKLGMKVFFYYFFWHTRCTRSSWKILDKEFKKSFARKEIALSRFTIIRFSFFVARAFFFHLILQKNYLSSFLTESSRFFVLSQARWKCGWRMRCSVTWGACPFRKTARWGLENFRLRCCTDIVK